ncbi:MULTISPECIES: YbgF trimerization domain-containing protein [Acinetobacter Taxon 24D]|uniref:YbgF trimerization domain-containing protein n=1 Tax=Acinetobacter Taxon 24D TaxID=2839057 RepID=UPI001039EEDE|nr:MULTISPECIES: YbgF trimerization domain-containing protein [Acinetobacter Taxon 24D]NNG83228.1 tetratricopeptide repeat protein [Acinetobacter sp. ANC 5378]TCH64254.1 tetratricopeptide repeat protein [Acinetobacter sp. ANC 4862]
MMLKQHALCVLTLLSSASLYANIPIESRGLSQTSIEPSANNVAIDSGATTANVPTNLNWQIMQKNQQLENDVRALRGKIEEQDNEIEKLKHELTNRYTDLDQRLELLQQKVDPESATPEEDNQQDTSPSTVNTPTPVAAKSTTISPAAVSTQANTQPSPADLDKAAYTVALDAYKQGGAKKAIAPMKNFIKNNPNSVYISNAYFWLAEFNLAIEPTNYTEAKKNYNIVINQYPNSAKAARALYQLHSIAKDVDRNTILANQLKTKLLKDYPKSEEAGYLKK